jgi:hypothetical protein
MSEILEGCGIAVGYPETNFVAMLGLPPDSWNIGTPATEALTFA